MTFNNCSLSSNYASDKKGWGIVLILQHILSNIFSTKCPMTYFMICSRLFQQMPLDLFVRQIWHGWGIFGMLSTGLLLLSASYQRTVCSDHGLHRRAYPKHFIHWMRCNLKAVTTRGGITDMKYLNGPKNLIFVPALGLYWYETFNRLFLLLIIMSEINILWVWALVATK